MSTCEAKIGYSYLPAAESLAGAWGCSDEATVTLRGACIHEHVRERRYCARHGVEQPPDGMWMCLPCAELGHDCPIRPAVVA